LDIHPITGGTRRIAKEAAKRLQTVAIHRNSLSAPDSTAEGIANAMSDLTGTRVRNAKSPPKKARQLPKKPLLLWSNTNPAEPIAIPWNIGSE
jgi:hypothetical protein